MDNKTFATAVTKFFYYANNWDTKQISYSKHGEEHQEWLPGFFGAFPYYLREHMLEKWNAAYDSAGPRGALMHFFADLDGGNRAILLRYINENYKYQEGFGIDLTSLDENQTSQS